MVQWLRLCTFEAGGVGSISAQGIKIPPVVHSKYFLKFKIIKKKTTKKKAEHRDEERKSQNPKNIPWAPGSICS